MLRTTVAPMDIDVSASQQRRSIFDEPVEEEIILEKLEPLPMELDSSPAKPLESAIAENTADLMEYEVSTQKSALNHSLLHFNSAAMDSNTVLRSSAAKSGTNGPENLTIVQPITYHFYNNQASPTKRPISENHHSSNRQDLFKESGSGARRFDEPKKVKSSKAPLFLATLRTLIPIVLIMVPLGLIIYDYTIKRSQLVSQELARQHDCTQQYSINRCHPDTRVPALDLQCKQWEHCMSSQLEVAGWRILAECMADFVEAFVGNVSYKSIAFILACFYIYAMGSSSSKNRTSNCANNTASDSITDKQYKYHAPRSTSKSEMMKYRRSTRQTALHLDGSDSDD